MSQVARRLIWACHSSGFLSQPFKVKLFPNHGFPSLSTMLVLAPLHHPCFPFSLYFNPGRVSYKQWCYKVLLLLRFLREKGGMSSKIHLWGMSTLGILILTPVPPLEICPEDINIPSLQVHFKPMLAHALGWLQYAFCLGSLWSQRHIGYLRQDSVSMSPSF